MDNLRLPKSNPHTSEDDRSQVDRMLHQRLSEIFRERCRGDSSLIEEFLRAPEQTEKNSIIDLLLEHDPVLGKKILKKLLRKLSLLWIAVLESYHKSAELLVRSGADVNELYALHSHYAISGLNKQSTILQALLEMDPSEKNERLILLVTDHGADLEARNSWGRTALHFAVMGDRVELIEMLLDKGADLQAWDSDGRTVLQLVVEKNRVRMLKMLLSIGAEIQLSTALSLALEHGRVQMTQSILEKAAADNVNVVNDADDADKLPLFVAVRSRKAIELLLLLIKHGADLKARDNLGRTVLHLAAMSGLVHVAEMLLEKGADLEARDSEERTVLHLVAMKDLVHVAEMLLEKGADLHARDSEGRTVLHLGAMAGQVHVAEMLLEKGADLQAQDSEERTVLHLVAMRGLVHVAEMLLEKGADLEARDSEGRTVLHLVAMTGLVHVAVMLLEKGAVLQARDSKRRTVLHCATTESQVRMTQMFLEKAALENVNLVNDADDEGNTPLLAAAGDREADKLVPLLVKHGADVSVKNADGENLLHRLSCGPVEHVDLARMFIEKDIFSIEDRDNKQEQLLHKAVAAGHNELVKLYLDHGANVNSLADNGESPLHLAVNTWGRSSASVIETLLKRGADIHGRTISEGQTPLHVACTFASRFFELVEPVEHLKLLLLAGSDVLVEDRGGNTPLSLLFNGPHMNRPSISIRLMLKTLALKKACQPKIVLKDENIIKQHSNWLDYYRDCSGQIDKMKSTKFINCTFFQLLTKCHCRNAVLFRNPNINNINIEDYDLNGFSEYAEDIRRDFAFARSNHDSMITHEHVINDGNYNTLPSVIVSKVAHYMLDCKCDFARSLSSNT